jgi:cobalt-precorrin 5A hydrolase
MNASFITLSPQGAALIPRLRREFPDLDCWVHESVTSAYDGRSFVRMADLVRDLFQVRESLIFAAPCGVVVRSIAPLLTSKLSDPAVVVMDVHARWAVSLLSGHEGGANQLAMRVANLFDAEPVITTTTETVKQLIVGVGCRRGASCAQITAAIHAALDQISVPLERVRLLASVAIKHDEAGLLEAAEQLHIPLRLISTEQLRSAPVPTSPSEFVLQQIGVAAVAEPAACLAGRRTRLLLPKTIFDSVTVAIAEESSTWLD